LALFAHQEPLAVQFRAQRVLDHLSVAVEVDLYVSLGVALIPSEHIEHGARAIEARHGL